MNQGYFYECLNFCAVLQAAARPRVREQRLRRVHAVPGRHRRRDPRPRRGDGRAGGDDRRHERRGPCARLRRRARRPRARRRRARASSRRSRIATSGTRAAIPARTGRPASSTSGASATRSSRLRAQLEAEGVERASARRDRAEVEGRSSSEMRERGLAAPFPEPGPTRGVQRVSRRLTMPKLSDSMAEATIVRWLKQPGERSRAASRWSRSRPTRRPSSTRPRPTACSPRSSSPRAARAALGEPIATLATTATRPGTPAPATARPAPAATARRAERDAGRAADRGRARHLAPRRSPARARAAGSRALDVAARPVAAHGAPTRSSGAGGGPRRRCESSS